MDSWIVVGPPRQFDQASDGSDIDVGWAWGIARREEQRTVAVLVAGGRLHDPCLPDECRRAIRTRGLSAARAVLEEESPPRTLVITSAGISRRG